MTTPLECPSLRGGIPARPPECLVSAAAYGLCYATARTATPVGNHHDRGLPRFCTARCSHFYSAVVARDQGYPEPPRSACTFCPYKSDAEWLRLKEQQPESFAEAVEIDSAIREGYIGNNAQLFVHRSLVPLALIDLASQRNQQDMFGNDCEGGCAT